MALKNNRPLRRRIIGSYLSSLISISLVLVLTGAVLLLVLGTGGIRDYLKENVHVTVVMKSGTPAVDAVAYQRQIEKLDFVKATRYISVQEGTAEMAELLGEDFLESFLDSPVPSSVDVSVKAEYLSKEGLETVRRELSRNSVVEEVSCRTALLDDVDEAVRKWVVVLAAAVMLMLFISVVLISGTVRLSLYSNRFSIRTMELVGATDRFISRPYVGRAAGQGLLSALIASATIAAAIFAAGKEFPLITEIFTPVLMVQCFVCLAIVGVLVCVFCAQSVLRRLVRLNPDEIYG